MPSKPAYYIVDLSYKSIAWLNLPRPSNGKKFSHVQLDIFAISKNAMIKEMASAGIAGSSWIHYAKMQADIMNGHKENESKCQNDEQSLHQSKNGHFGIISGLDAY